MMVKVLNFLISENSKLRNAFYFSTLCVLVYVPTQGREGKACPVVHMWKLEGTFVESVLPFVWISGNQTQIIRLTHQSLLFPGPGMCFQAKIFLMQSLGRDGYDKQQWLWSVKVTERFVRLVYSGSTGHHQ